MNLEQVAEGVVRISVMPLGLVNAYLLGDVLVDSGGPFGGKRLLAALSGRKITAHALTHGHFDHQGSSHFICKRLGIPLWCGEGDREAVETGDQALLFSSRRALLARMSRRMAGPAHPVSRTLQDGDEFGGFQVIKTPGHTPGHLAFWRESDRLLVLGDVLFHRDPATLKRGLREPFASATIDVARNREAARKLAALDPAIVCFGHGEPLRDTRRFREFVATLPRSEISAA
jgi:glyoxylase-like metal-dependent hydrolase (beta-lactamase superfamily II)